MAARYTQLLFRRVGVDPANFSFEGNFTSRSEIIENWSDKTFCIFEQTGQAITAMVSMEGSIDGNQWIELAQLANGEGFIVIPETIQLVRIVVTVHVAGDIRAGISGFDQRIGQ